MPHRRFTHYSRRTAPTRRALAVALGCAAAPMLQAQAPTVPHGAPAQPPYRAPLIAIVQPVAGASIPSDKPVAVFRFSPGDPGDPIDARSFAVAVNGEDRSALFQVTATEAWGPLAPLAGDQPIAAAPGVHRVAARVCSVRGACTEVIEMVAVVAPTARAPESTPSADRKRSLLDLVLLALRKLIEP